MINVITDLIQSAGIMAWAIFTFCLTLRVNRLNARLDQNSIAIAQLREEVREEEVREIQEPQAICGCGHHQCFHDDTSCAKIEIWSHYDGSGYEKSKVPCGCKRYTGPEQLPTVIP